MSRRTLILLPAFVPVAVLAVVWVAATTASDSGPVEPAIHVTSNPPAIEAPPLAPGPPAVYDPTVQRSDGGAVVALKDPKLASHLVLLADAAAQAEGRGQRLTASSPPQDLPRELQGVIASRQMRLTDAGEVQVFIIVGDTSAGTRDALEALGARIERVEDDARIVQAKVPARNLRQIAQLGSVRKVRLPDYPFVLAGSVLTEGDAILNADDARTTFGLDGTGVRVGVLSDGVEGLSLSKTSGDLPPSVDITTCNMVAESPTSSGAGAEGTAMLEIVHDLAPGADLLFGHFGLGFSGTSLDFNAAVNCLADNADVVIDDIGFFNNGLYDGTSSVSQNTAAALNGSGPIRVYTNAVGNQALQHYQESYVDSGFDIIGDPDVWSLQRFVATATTTDAGFGDPCSCGDAAVVGPGDIVIVFLQWNDAFGASTNDYDFFLWSRNLAAFVDIGGNAQTGSQDPAEVVAYQNDTGVTDTLDIFIGNYNDTAAPRTFDMFVRCLGCGNHNYNTLSSSVPNNSDAAGSPVPILSSGAINAADPGNDTIAGYSSRGPTNDGRTKPDITAIDGVSVTGNGGFPSTFFGTSAAAPHIGGIAALLLECNPSISRSGLRNAITSTAVDLGSPNTYGAGRIDAFAAASAAGCSTPTSTPTPTPTMTPTPTATPQPDKDGDTVPDASDNCPNDANADQEDIDGDSLGDACDPDSSLIDADGDGCVDGRETGPNEALGGLRDPANFWDFFDVPDSSNIRDGIVVGADIVRVVLRFSASGDPTIDPLSPPPPAPAYHPAFDRSPAGPGDDPWDLGPADGIIIGPDIVQVVLQFSHSCLAPP